jgi:hypothetical protein
MAFVKVAVTILVLSGTAIAPESGVTALTMGVACAPPLPRIGVCPPEPPPHAVTSAPNNIAANHRNVLAAFTNFSICFSSFCGQKPCKELA